ncbi:hypothetical protein B0H15DRAFT_833940 [Mycena belliarum]|uniref:Uncharacterized protein n=1 Tax=Mycena belliarum TaxID=1033014 RepID=A0AAD6XSP3_9AGAR|nr:hypothetical protein B0H15DRAFT_833940 [Mycena belliae]
MWQHVGCVTAPPTSRCSCGSRRSGRICWRAMEVGSQPRGRCMCALRGRRRRGAAAGSYGRAGGYLRSEAGVSQGARSSAARAIHAILDDAKANRCASYSLAGVCIALARHALLVARLSVPSSMCSIAVFQTATHSGSPRPWHTSQPTIPPPAREPTHVWSHACSSTCSSTGLRSRPVDAAFARDDARERGRWWWPLRHL